MATTFAAHIITADAHGLGDPEIVVMAKEEDGQEQTVASYLLDGDAYDTLSDMGWWIGHDATDVEAGYRIVSLEIKDHEKVLSAITSKKTQAERDLQETAAAWGVLVEQSLDAAVPVSKIAAAAGVSVQRIYQIRDAR